MKFNVKLGEFNPENPVRVGNVYPVKGGYGTRNKHMMVLLSITSDSTCLCLVLDKDGKPVSTTQYGIHIMEERMPIGFVPGLVDLEFDMVPL